ncbi:dephospho-CoA kinase [Mesonia aquimarina]|uniref:dephospho-CoA kinase n=1 Tax=Mesonia aquimarina TaxID=1504967 RepID=UPI000EF5E9E0|nr:dephospho-CoA kinase [Mesonia aquimarina]
MIIGLTGGIGSGKTTVAKMFESYGIPIYIADEEAKKMLNFISVKKEVIQLLGENAYKNNQPDREYIASKVFADAELLAELNGIIHPRVQEHFQEWYDQQQSAYVIYEAAILFEKGGYKKCDFSILVTAPKDEKIKRLQERDNSSKEQIEARMKNQWSDEKKKDFADFIIENIELETTKLQVKKLHERLLNKGKS